jgi:hypothetical protein
LPTQLPVEHSMSQAQASPAGFRTSGAVLGHVIGSTPLPPGVFTPGLPVGKPGPPSAEKPMAVVLTGRVLQPRAAAAVAISRQTSLDGNFVSVIARLCARRTLPRSLRAAC